MLRYVFAVTLLVLVPCSSRRYRENVDIPYFAPQTDWDRKEAHDALFKSVRGDVRFPTWQRGPDLAAIKDKKYRWKGYPGNPVVPYVIDGSLESSRSLITRAMTVIQDNSCAKFVARSNEANYININQQQGCWSMLGMIGGKQDVSLGDGCLYIGTVIHELLHALGIYHEHQRSDRDTYLVIHPENIQSGAESQFTKTKAEDEEIYNQKFDYESIMIYGNNAFSKDSNKHTMDAKDNTPLKNPYDKEKMTDTDIRLLNLHYECAAKGEVEDGPTWGPHKKGHRLEYDVKKSHRAHRH